MLCELAIVHRCILSLCEGAQQKETQGILSAPAKDASTLDNLQTTPRKRMRGKQEQQRLLANRRADTTLQGAIADYLLDHEGVNSSLKTLQRNIDFC